jgi:hypothetical protein
LPVAEEMRGDPANQAGGKAAEGLEFQVARMNSKKVASNYRTWASGSFMYYSHRISFLVLILALLIFTVGIQFWSLVEFAKVMLSNFSIKSPSIL